MISNSQNSSLQSPSIPIQNKKIRTEFFSVTKFIENNKFALEVTSEFLDVSDEASMFQVNKTWRRILLAKSAEERNWNNIFFNRNIQFFKSNFPIRFNLNVDLSIGKRLFPIECLGETEEFRFPLNRKNRIKQIGERIFVALNLRSQILLPESPIRKNKELMLIAIGIDYSLYNYADPKLMRDRDIVLAVIKHNTSYSSSNPDFILSRFLSTGLLNDREFILEVLTVAGLELRNVPEQFKADKVCVLKAVKNRGISLQYASEDLRKDREVVGAAASNHKLALQYASTDLLHNKEFILELYNVHEVPLYLELYLTLPEKLRQDDDIILAFLAGDYRLFERLPAKLRDSSDFLLSALQADPNAIQFASSRLKKNQVDFWMHFFLQQKMSLLILILFLLLSSARRHSS